MASSAAIRGNLNRSGVPRWLMILILFGCYLCIAVEGVKARSGRKKKAYGIQFKAFLSVMKYTILLSILPIILYFIYSVLTDPDLPRVVKYLWNAGKKRWLSYLGKPQLSVEPDLTEDDAGFLGDPFGLYDNDKKYR